MVLNHAKHHICDLRQHFYNKYNFFKIKKILSPGAIVYIFNETLHSYCMFFVLFSLNADIRMQEKVVRPRVSLRKKFRAVGDI